MVHNLLVFNVDSFKFFLDFGSDAYFELRIGRGRKEMKEETEGVSFPDKG